MADYLYIHIPFCIKKCVYCDFYSIPFKSQIGEDYISALCREIKLRILIPAFAGTGLRTIYIGGGTPTILSEKEISRALNAVRENYSIHPDVEITVEANPRTISEKKAESLLKSGINRISIGMQSFIDVELAILGRSHNADDAVKALKDVRRAGFNNISIDLIYGIPGQKMDDLEYSLEKTIELSPTHISAYELTPEKNTPLHESIKQGRIVMPDEGLIAEMYYKGIDILKEHGYKHYEISNFAKHGYECRHNLNYWNMGEYLGVGAGAHSFLNKKRTSNIRDVNAYIEFLNSGISVIEEETEISDDEALKEFIFLGLRKTEGIDINRIPDEKRLLIMKAVEDISSHGLIELKDNYLRLTGKGLLLSNEVIVKLLLYIEMNRP